VSGGMDKTHDSNISVEDDTNGRANSEARKGDSVKVSSGQGEIKII
jgi:hypothetical protein